MSDKPTLWEMILSVLAAALGVQKSSAHRRDFEKGNPWMFIVLGLIGTVLFVLSVMFIVKWVLSSHGVG